MPRKEVPLQTLSDFVPEGAETQVLQYLKRHGVHLTITQARRSVLGDYRHRLQHQPHRISVNGNLNRYAFLITLLHELAHLITFERFGNRVSAHGHEWKTCFGDLLNVFLEQRVFPEPLTKELLRTMRNPAASSCAEDGLIRVLRQYDDPGKKEKYRLIEELEMHELFCTTDGRQFRLEKKMRKRFLCTEPATGKQYLFSPVYEVIPVAGSSDGFPN